MSTRATYQFITDYSNVTCYIHHDGYPSGAACYLEGANTVEKFIRKNENAEITLSHESHADTEYRYTVFRGTMIQVMSRRPFTSDEWIEESYGQLADFVGGVK